MNDIDLDALEALEKAIDRDWSILHTDEDHPMAFIASIGDVICVPDPNFEHGDEATEKRFAFIVAMRNAAPALIGAARRDAEKSFECAGRKQSLPEAGDADVVLLRGALTKAREALNVLYDEADNFSVSGVYFNEECMEHKGLRLAGDAIAAIDFLLTTDPIVEAI